VVLRLGVLNVLPQHQLAARDRRISRRGEARQAIAVVRSGVALGVEDVVVVIARKVRVGPDVHEALLAEEIVVAELEEGRRVGLRRTRLHDPDRHRELADEHPPVGQEGDRHRGRDPGHDHLVDEARGHGERFATD
jgi:hypothetical protein